MTNIAELKAALVAAGVNKTVPDDLLSAYLVATDNDVSAAVDRLKNYIAARQSFPRVAPTIAAAQKLISLGLVGTSTNASGQVVIWHMSGQADPSAILKEEYTQGMLAIVELKSFDATKGLVLVADWADFKRPGFIDNLNPSLANEAIQYFATVPIKVGLVSSILVNTTPEVKAEFVSQGHMYGEKGTFVGSNPEDILAAVGTTDTGLGNQGALLAELETNKAALEWRWTQLQD
ncbi:hypothetical protein HDE_04359 [Halotydeus destructor]|nr:hypothetical protein HDE_04359 [Halotydeus destructor]